MSKLCGVLCVLTLLTAAAGASEVRHRSVVIPLEAGPGYVTKTAYADGSLWLITTQGEAWHYDGQGRGTKLSVPDGVKLHGIQAIGRAAAVAFSRAGLHELTAERVISPPHELERSLRKIVPFGEGVMGISQGEAGAQIRTMLWDAPSTPLFNLVRRGTADEIQTAYPVALPEQDRQTGLPWQEWRSREIGVLVPLDEERVAYVSHQPYEVWILGLDGSIRHLPIDASSVMRPEEAPSQSRRGRLVEMGDQSTSRAIAAGDKLVVQSYLKARFEQTQIEGEGRFTYGSIAFLDTIDLATGKVVERLLPPYPGRWTGLRGLSPVFWKNSEPSNHFGDGSRLIILNTP